MKKAYSHDKEELCFQEKVSPTMKNLSSFLLGINFSPIRFSLPWYPERRPYRFSAYSYDRTDRSVCCTPCRICRAHGSRDISALDRWESSCTSPEAHGDRGQRLGGRRHRRAGFWRRTSRRCCTSSSWRLPGTNAYLLFERFCIVGGRNLGGRKWGKKEAILNANFSFLFVCYFTIF